MAEDKKKLTEEMEFEETYLSRRQLIWRAFKKHKLGMFGLWVLIIMYLMAIFADFLSPHNPYEQSLIHSYAPPTPIHFKYKGKSMGMYVLPSVSFIDKFTSERKFYEMLFPKAIYTDEGKYEIDNGVARIDGKSLKFDRSKGEEVYFEFAINKSIGFTTKDGKNYSLPFEKEYTKRLLIGYNDGLLRKGTVRIDLTVPTAKTAVLSNFGDFSKKLKTIVNSEENIDKLWLDEKLERIDVKWARTISRNIKVDEFKRIVSNGAKNWMESVLKPLKEGKGSVDQIREAGVEVEKMILADFERALDEGYIDALINGDEMAINRIVSISKDLVSIGIDVKGRLEKLSAKLANLKSSGESKAVMKDIVREEFYSMGKEAVDLLVRGYKKSDNKKAYIDNVVNSLSKGVENYIDVCNLKLEKMVKEMRYEEREAEGIIRACLTNLMRSEIFGSRYLPGETMAIANMLVNFKLIDDPNFKSKIEDYKKVSSLKAIYENLQSILGKFAKPGRRPSKDQMKEIQTALEEFINKAKNMKFSTESVNSELRSVIRSAEGSLRYLKRGRSVYYYYRRILDGLRDVSSAKSILESVAANIVGVGEIGFSYPKLGEMAFKKYRLETVKSIVLNGKGVRDYDYRIYKVKFFLKSWKGKFLWLVPSRIHLFGVENPDDNPYVKLFIMGADQFGRDVWSRIVFASRVSLSIGIIGMIITFGLALIFGGISGYYGGIIDEIMMRIAEIIMSIPGFYLLIMLRALLPMDIPSTQIYILLVFILSFIGWAGTSRVIRGMVLSIRRREFVEAAIAIGLPDSKVLMRHVLPNTTSFLIVSATLRIPGYILGEASLSYLGLGIREPDASWGLMLAQAQDVYVMQHAPWLLIPGAFIFFTVLSFNFVGDALRDALDPRSLG